MFIVEEGDVNVVKVVGLRCSDVGILFQLEDECDRYEVDLWNTESLEFNRSEQQDALVYGEDWVLSQGIVLYSTVRLCLHVFFII